MREEDREGSEINKTKLFYKEALRQYDLEMDSYNTLTDKANSILVSIGTILTLLTIAVIQIVTSKVSPNPLLLMVLLIIPYTFLITSLLLSIESYSVSELATINPKKLIEKYYSKSENEILMQLISNISNDLVENKKITEDRSTLINQSLKSLKKGIITLIIVISVYVIINYIFIL